MIEWWCHLFGYDSCWSMPTPDAYVVWGVLVGGVTSVYVVAFHWITRG